MFGKTQQHKMYAKQHSAYEPVDTNSNSSPRPQTAGEKHPRGPTSSSYDNFGANLQTKYGANNATFTPSTIGQQRKSPKESQENLLLASSIVANSMKEQTQ